MSVDEYLATVKALIVGNAHIVRWEVRREEILADAGLFRYRVVLISAWLDVHAMDRESNP